MLGEHHALPEGPKHVIDALAVGATVGALIDWLPALAALLSVIWTLIRIYETDTVQALLRKEPTDER